MFSSFADIQEFYELTLLDDSKTIQQKTAETLQIASKWEQDGHAIKIADVSREKEEFSELHSSSFCSLLVFIIIFLLCNNFSQ